MKKLLVILASLAASVAIVMFLPSMRTTSGYALEENVETGLFHQIVTRINSDPATIHCVYEEGNLIGILRDRKKLDQHLDQVYHEKYEEKYPNTEVYLSKDLYITDEQTYFEYNDADDEILAYLDEKDKYCLGATAVSFSQDDEVYSRIYVSSEEMYEEAMNEYLSLFISPETITILTSGQTTPELTTYGSRDVGITISQTITTADDYARPEEIKTTKEEILEYLKYGDNKEREYYTVKQYDTVAGVGSKNYGLSATQVMNINRDKISSIDQVLSEGMELCITYFTSPIEIIVYKETLRQQDIYYETTYYEDDTILKGELETVQAGVNGSKNTLFSEKWVNGVLVSGVEVSSVETKQPQSEVVAVGIMELPDVGTGEFRFPVDNAMISCGWGCYYGHRGTDIQNRYDRWGKVLAADRGVIMQVSYDRWGGNWVKINHNNGWVSYYGHMRSPCPLPVGTVVDKGDEIGDIGMTGLATGPHVHFFLEWQGSRRDACTVLNCSGR